MGAQVFVSIAPTFTVARAEFSAMCRSIFLLSCLGLVAGEIQHGKCSVTYPEEPSPSTCCDVDEDTNAKCVEHVNWAMGEGVAEHKQWYAPYNTDKDSSFADFQCTLFKISFNKAHAPKESGSPSEHHSCPRPCSSTDGCEVQQPQFKATTDKCFPATKYPAPTDCKCGTVVVTAAGECTDPNSESCKALNCTKEECTPNCPSSLSPLMIALICLLALALIAALAYFLCMGKDKAPKKKKKRTVKAPVVQPAPPPATPEPVQAVSYTMAPVQTTSFVQAPPVYATMTQPVQTTAMPMVQYAAPAQQMQYAAPAQQMQYAVAQPQVMQYAVPAYQQGQTLFDALDRNGDGVISRNEIR